MTQKLILEACSFGVTGSILAGFTVFPLIFFKPKAWLNVMAWGFEISALSYIGIIFCITAAMH